VDERDIDRTAAMIRSMTPAERQNPKIINASRRKRIAAGSGTTVTQVNALLDRFGEAKKMMGSMAGRLGFPGARKATKSPAKGKKGKKGKSGRGPTPPKVRGGFPGMPGGFPGAPGAGGMPAGFPGLDQLPPDFDLSKLNLPKN
jgi:signal recognition particle subunit SRP54